MFDRGKVMEDEMDGNYENENPLGEEKFMRYFIASGGRARLRDPILIYFMLYV